MVDKISGMPFHSAVNRIPLPRPQVLSSLGRRPEVSAIFGDGEPFGHDHLASDRWSGTIDLEMIVRTPLVFGEQQKLEGDNGPTTVILPVRKGKLFVPSTMVKGMISRAYEILTASRFRVFDAHDDALTYRGDPASAASLIPLQVVSRNDDGSLIVNLFRGDTTVNGDYEERGIVYPAMYAAALQDAAYGHAHLAPRMTLDKVRQLTPHKKTITCDMSLCLHGANGRGAKYSYWQVTDIYTENGQKIELFKIDPSVPVVDSLKKVQGIVCRTTPDDKHSKDLFSSKHDERVFFDVDARGAEQVVVAESVSKAYEVVVRSYEAERRREADQRLPHKLRHTPNRATRALQSVLLKVDSGAGHHERFQLETGDLAFAVVGNDASGASEVLEIVPIMVGRHAYQRSPRKLAKEQRILPLSGLKEASPADRLFGYVIQDPQQGATGGNVAYRGRISFGTVDTSEATVRKDERLFAPLLSAKLGSARRFLTDTKGGTPRTGGEVLQRSDYYANGQYLGAAAFPVHRKALKSSGFPASATELPPVNGMDQTSQKTRLKVPAWVASGSVLRCQLSFTNLLSVELAALLWVLNPTNLVPVVERDKDSDACGYLRMGLGKPLGLGAIEVRLGPGGVRAKSGQDMADDYASLTSCVGESSGEWNKTLGDFVQEETLLSMPWIRALQRAAFGYSDDYPVRYMTLEENKVNNKTDYRTGEAKKGVGLSPKDLHSEDVQPLQILL